MGKAKTFEVELQIAPLSGKPRTKKVKVKASATLSEVLEAAGLDSSRKALTVDGKETTADTRITSDSKVTVSEQPQGS